VRYREDGAVQVETRRVELYRFFKDFDRSEAYTRVVTPTQFGRILAMLKVAVNPEDSRLLCRKFADATTGDFNYPAFVQCVDKMVINYTVDRLKDYDCAPACPKVVRRSFIHYIHTYRPQSRSLESQTAGLQSLWLASRLKPWLRTIDGLRWLMAASHGLRVQTRKRTAAN